MLAPILKISQVNLTEKLKQDTVELANKAGEKAKDNFIFRILIDKSEKQALNIRLFWE